MVHFGLLLQAATGESGELLLHTACKNAMDDCTNLGNRDGTRDRDGTRRKLNCAAGPLTCLRIATSIRTFEIATVPVEI